MALNNTTQRILPTRPLMSQIVFTIKIKQAPVARRHLLSTIVPQTNRNPNPTLTVTLK